MKPKIQLDPKKLAEQREIARKTTPFIKALEQNLEYMASATSEEEEIRYCHNVTVFYQFLLNEQGDRPLASNFEKQVDYCIRKLEQIKDANEKYKIHKR